jgi:HEAT repeats
MPGRHRAGRKVAGFLVVAVLVTGIAAAIKYRVWNAGRSGSGGANASSSAINENSPLADLNKALANGDPRAVALIEGRATPRPGVPQAAYTDGEAEAWIQTLTALRANYRNLTVADRASAITAACRIFDGFAVGPAPGCWVEALKPLHDLFSASLNEPHAQPRYAALREISRFWVWIPGCSVTPFEEQTLAEWKGGLYVPVVHCLASRDVATRIATISCLGTLPIDNAADAAVAYIDDPIADVRRQTLSSFAQRGLILTDDMLLKHLHDEDAVVRDMANLVLKTRGLPQELIGLGGLMYSPRADQRVSVITLLKGRTDIDVVNWLIQLSKDPVETVRISAMAALAKHKTPVVEKRLAEMARSDGSEAVRKAARKLVPASDETTAALPPLPGSANLNPKAN